MPIISDLHIHSRFSRACSNAITLPKLEQYAKIKGIDLLGTGDFTHPKWFEEIKRTLHEREGILYSQSRFPFLLTGEISLIYTHEKKGRRVHYLLLAPSLEVVRQIHEALLKKGRIDYDGRPIFGFSSPELVDLMRSISEEIEIIPAHCLLPETFIHTKGGVKQIKEATSQDLVLTHAGRYKKIEKVYSRQYWGEVIKIIPWYFRNGLTATPEHPILAIKSFKNCSWTKGTCKPLCSDKTCKKKKYRYYTPQWIQIKDIEEKDFILYPRLKETRDISTLHLSDFCKNGLLKEGLIYAGNGNTKKLLPNEIQLNKDFCRLLGYYLAEGYVSNGAISFSFNENEEEYIADVKSLMLKLWGIKETREIKKFGGVEIQFFSTLLEEFFSSLCYIKKEKRAWTKSLPEQFLYLPKEKQEELFRGWWRGDTGYTTSRELSNQMKIICLRLGIIPSIFEETATGYNSRGKHFIKGRKIISKRSIFIFSNLSFFEKSTLLLDKTFKKFINKKNFKHGWMDEGYAYLPIRKVRVLKHHGEVLNLEVEEDNSYTTEFMIAHNCWTPHFAIFGSLSGFDSVEECFGEKAKHIHALETGMSCYDEETEVLTLEGWKRVAEANLQDKICTLNLKTEEIEFQYPTKLFKYDYRGKMYRLKTRRVDLLVTPNHNLVYSRCDFRKKYHFLLGEAQSLFNKSKLFKKNGEWKGETKGYFIIPPVKIPHGSRYYSGLRIKKEKKISLVPWLRFFGFWIAEGWTTNEGNGQYGIYLANSKGEMIKEMKNILESFGYNVYFYTNRNLGTIRVRDYQLFSYLRQFGKAEEKYFPLEIKSLSKELLKVAFDYYIKGDGHHYGRTGRGLSATTISKKLRDDLQEIALKLGISAYYKLHRRKGAGMSSLPFAKLRDYKQSADSWVIYFIRKNIHSITPSAIKKHSYIEAWVDYQDSVYCLEVPNHTLYIRRNGIPVWCGNSDPEMNWRISRLDKYNLVSFSDSHSFWPYRLGREATIFELEKLTYQNIIKAIRDNGLESGFDKNHITSTIETDPAYGKYHFDGHRSCSIVSSPEKTLETEGVCPVCRKQLTLGVAYRVEQLADRPLGFVKKNAIPFKSLIPLQEIIAGVYQTSVGSKTTQENYDKLIQLGGSENNILLNVSEEVLIKSVHSKLAEAIIRSRNHQIEIKPGYDGVYGEPIFENAGQTKEPRKKETALTPIKKKQKSLTEF